MRYKICLHRLEKVEPELLVPFDVVANTQGREQLVRLLASGRIDALVIDIGEPDALAIVARAREICPGLAIVGATAEADTTLLIAAQRAGCTQIARRPIEPDDLLDALNLATERRAEAGTRGSVIAMLGTIGGAGTTTLACNLAVEMAALSGADTCVLDLDLEFGGVSRSFDQAPRHTLRDVVNTKLVDGDILRRAAVKLNSGVALLVPPTDISASQEIDPQVLIQVIHAARAEYQCTIIDLPRRLDSVTGSAIEAATKLLLVTQLTVPAIANARRLLLALAHGGLPLDRVEIVVNRFRKNIHSCTVEMIQKELDKPIFGVVPSDYCSVSRAIDFGQALDKKGPVRAAVAEIAAKLVEPGGPTAAGSANARTRGWLGRLGLQSQPAVARK